jgi:hypothetical protein
MAEVRSCVWDQHWRYLQYSIRLCIVVSFVKIQRFDTVILCIIYNNNIAAA